MQKLRLTLAVALAIVGLAGSVSAQIIVQSANITVDTTWGDNETEVVLQQPIFVNNGATLTILQGTIIRGQPRSAAVVPGQVAGSPGALVVTQRGKIRALGAANDPIIMTTAAVDNDNNGVADDVDAPIGFEDEWVPGDIFLDDDPLGAPLAPLDKSAAGNSNVALWGGLVLLGRAPTNLSDFCGVGLTGMCTVEGLTVPGFPAADAMYGGVEPHDSSGIVQYVSVRHAGDEIGGSNELNGVTLGGVGDGTIFEFVEVYANFDDGIEWFGGTVHGNNLVVAFAGDDSFDADQGYTGVNQFLFAVMNFFNENDGGLFGTGSGDKACEFDGDDFNEPTVNVNLVGPDSIVVPGNAAPWPLSHGFFQNMTVIGSTPDSGAPGSAVDFTPVSPAAANLGCQMRSGFAGELRNSIVVNTGAMQGFDASSGGAPGYSTSNNIDANYDGKAGGDLLRVYCSTFDDGLALPAGDDQDALANGDLIVATTADNNVVNSASFAGLIEEDQTFNPTGNAAGKLAATLVGANGLINPRPAFGLVGIGGCAGPTESGTDGNAVYRGAFIRTASRIWTTDWTVLNLAGLMAD
jgi:hypothetical protein